MIFAAEEGIKLLKRMTENKYNLFIIFFNIILKL